MMGLGAGYSDGFGVLILGGGRRNASANAPHRPAVRDEQRCTNGRGTRRRGAGRGGAGRVGAGRGGVPAVLEGGGHVAASKHLRAVDGERAPAVPFALRARPGSALTRRRACERRLRPMCMVRVGRGVTYGRWGVTWAGRSVSAGAPPDRRACRSWQRGRWRPSRQPKSLGPDRNRVSASRHACRLCPPVCASVPCRACRDLSDRPLPIGFSEGLAARPALDTPWHSTHEESPAPRSGVQSTCSPRQLLALSRAATARMQPVHALISCASKAAARRTSISRATTSRRSSWSDPAWSTAPAAQCVCGRAVCAHACMCASVCARARAGPSAVAPVSRGMRRVCGVLQEEEEGRAKLSLALPCSGDGHSRWYPDRVHSDLPGTCHTSRGEAPRPDRSVCLSHMRTVRWSSVNPDSA
jgi:hypothetical protein